ncbi:MAG TPA: hypothetical protein VFT19_03225 [Solirubrobacterales bacterium]|nr:hypothetical protein [Solirubrobacterales bacterium]
MKQIRKWRKPSPALIIAIVALSAALVGTAVAGPIAGISLSKKEKKQTRKIARQQANQTFNKRKGELVGPQGPKGEQGEKGDKGDKGDTGPQGPTGPSDLYAGSGAFQTVEPGERHTIAQVVLPAGQYLVTASHTAQPSGGEAEFDCFIHHGTTDALSFYMKDTTPHTMSGTTPLTLGSTTIVRSECRAFTNNVLIASNSARISAIKVGAIH